MSWTGHTLLPAVDGALRDEFGQYVRPKDQDQLVSWLRATGCCYEASIVQGMSPRAFRELLGWFRARFRD